MQIDILIKVVNVILVIVIIGLWGAILVLRKRKRQVRKSRSEETTEDVRQQGENASFQHMGKAR